MNKHDVGYSILKREYWCSWLYFEKVRFETQASNTWSMSNTIIESLGGFVIRNMKWTWIIRMNTVRIDPKSNWLKLTILSLIVVSNTQSHFIVFNYSIYLFVTLIIRVIQLSQIIRFQSQFWKKFVAHQTINSDRRISPFNTQYKSNNEIHSHSLPFYSWLFGQYNDIMRLSSTIQFTHLIVFIQSLPIYRMKKFNTFLFWSLNQTRFYHFPSSISHKFLVLILNMDTTNDWNMLAKPIWVVITRWKRVNGRLDPKSMNKEWW